RLSMLPDRSSTLSGSIKLLFLALAVFVVLAQTSPGNQLRREKGKERKSGILGESLGNPGCVGGRTAHETAAVG
ncbi:Hypothetical predicted protein, partial [Marmota monax]